jgi:hypothetical protein
MAYSHEVTGRLFLILDFSLPLRQSVSVIRVTALTSPKDIPNDRAWNSLIKPPFSISPPIPNYRSSSFNEEGRETFALLQTTILMIKQMVNRLKIVSAF